MVPFSRSEALIFLACMALYTTDVVRSGLGIKDVTAFGIPKVDVDTFLIVGPYEYPLQTIYRNLSSEDEDQYHGFAVDGTRGHGIQVDQVLLRPYKFDTLSIGPRALAIHLNVEEFPECLLTTNSPCPEDRLPLKTVFWMLEGLITAIQDRFLVDSPSAAFAVEHQWIDSLEQMLYGKVHELVTARYFALHSYECNATHGVKPIELLHLCPFAYPGYNRPFFCHAAPWRTWSILRGQDASYRGELILSVDEDIALRFARFQAENPELDMEMLILSGQNVQWMDNPGGLYYDWNSQDVVVLIRGRLCDVAHLNCETVLIDDYRYQRTIIATNVADMFSIVATIRGLGQAYVWLRVAMLVIGIGWSTWRETTLQPTHGFVCQFLYMAFVNLLKVPSHVVIFGTTVPVVLYAVAHAIDSHIYHLIIQGNLSTVMGTDPLVDLNSDITYLNLKMRNVWFTALLGIAFVVYNTSFRQIEAWQHRMGVVGFRDSLMSSLSILTIVFQVQIPSLRRADIRSVTRHDVNWRVSSVWTSMRHELYPATTGPFLEIRSFFLAFVACGVLLTWAKLLLMGIRYRIPKLMDQSTIVPYSAGTLWPTIALTAYWSTNVEPIPQAPSSSRVVPTIAQPPVSFNTYGDVGIPTHIRALRIERRSEQVWALLRLMNVVMMTDPWVYVRLRFIGVKLYLYRLQHHDDHGIAYLLPERLDRLYELNQLDHQDRFELVQVVSSTSVSWHELIMCG